MRLFFFFMLFLVLQIYGAVAQDGAKSVLENTLNQYVQPSYARLQDSARQLQGSIAQLCNTPSRSNLDEAQSSFHELVNVWGFIEWFRVAPIVSNNRVERIFFFPDRKSRGLRQVQAALVQQNEAVLDIHKLKEMSVALQGLGALDFLLFGKGSDALTSKGSFRCGFAKSVSQNLYQISTIVHDAWQNDDLEEAWRIPGKTNPLYRTEQEAMSLIVGTLIHGLEAIRDTRISVFLKEEPNRDRPKSAPFWRSRATLLSIAANLQGLERLFTQSQIETILPEDARYLGNTIRFEFEQSIKTAEELNAPIADLLSEPEQREKLEYLKLTISFIIMRLNDELSPAIGITAGFSFGDGD